MKLAKPTLLLVLFLLGIVSIKTDAQSAKISEQLLEFNTYPFSDPNPVPEINRIYPYFYFNGFTNKASIQKWKMVVLENDYIKVFVCPDIGGKVWGAIEKSTGKEFLYYNHAVKFRDVGMRGPWTSGGLEYNFGDIGHIPTGATPVDYVTRTNSDGSVSCSVGAIDLPSGTKWNVEIKVSPHKAFFETKTSWNNNTELPCTYYHWMNAAAKAADDLELIYPGNDWIGHGTETGSWPEENGRKINWYRENNFGNYKSYHVINAFANYFGGYYHNENFGFGHLSDFDEKPGKKLWIWGLSQQGMIWEELLSDTDGQYIEFQAGKLFNQAADKSTLTPFKHKEFMPHDADIMHEIWFPLVSTGGMKEASEFGIINVTTENQKQNILFSALQNINDEIKVYKNGELIFSDNLNLKPLEKYETSVVTKSSDELLVTIGNDKLRYTSSNPKKDVNRPVKPNSEFNWDSAYGLFTKGLENEKQRNYKLAEDFYAKSLIEEPAFVPALNRLALSHYRKMNYKKALDLLLKSLAVDTYNGETNYYLGLVCRETGDILTAKSGFSVAMGDVTYRSAAAAEMANTLLVEKQWNDVIRYAQKALSFNTFNSDALETLALAYRKTNQPEKAEHVLFQLEELNATNHFIRSEKYFVSGNNESKNKFVSSITNELPSESFLDLALNYKKKGCFDEATEILKLAEQTPIIQLWQADLHPESTSKFIELALEQPADFVLPHRVETAKMLASVLEKVNHWKLNYYLGLVYWNKGLMEKAKEQFKKCRMKPDFAPFYLAKAKLFDSKEIKAESIKKAVSINPNDWRANLELAKIYLTDNKTEDAKSLVEPFLKRYPEQSSIGLFYAKTLNKLKQYNAAIKFLENYEVLPFEGATEGRDLYRTACIKRALVSLSQKNYNSATKYINKSKLWPKNLGVGQPYHVDERLEDYILYLANKAKGRRSNANNISEKILNYKPQTGKQENVNLYLQLSLLSEKGQKNEAEKLLQEFVSKNPDNKSVKWVSAKLNNKKEAENLLNAENDDSRIMPYDSKFVDRNLELLQELLQITE